MEELTTTIARIRELEEEQAAIVAELDELKDNVKEFMKANGTSKVRVDKYNVSYSEYTTKRFDSTRFKAEHEDVYNEYVKETKANRLTISLAKK